MITRQTILQAGAALLATGLLVSCQGTHRARTVETSGFLQNYQQLQPGKEGQALLLYVNRQADFSRYNTILLDPVRLYAARGSLLMNASPATRQNLVNYLDAEIRDELKGSFAFVNRPGPGVMRFRIAITDAQGSMVLMDTASSVVPIGLAVSVLKSGLTGAHSAVGSCSIEGEILDATTGERLAAVVDKRVGDKFTGQFDKLDQWHAVKTACDYWAALLKIRLLKLQAGLRP
ncbi:MAG: DUF3313 domain-containing protein [bacterium]